MIRHTLITIFIAGLCIYSFKDWYKSLCGLIVFMAIFQHPDVKGSILGIQGLNPWNILFACVFMGWLISRGNEKLKWDMPPKVVFLLITYLIIILIGFYRLISDQSDLVRYAIITESSVIPSNEYLWSEYLVNAIKWAIPGFLLYDGCRNPSRFKYAVFAILVVYFLLAVQVIKWMPLGSFGSGDELSYRSSKIIQNEIGYNRVNLSAMLAGGSWALLSAAATIKEKLISRLLIIGGITVMFAQGLTGGRAGYFAFVVLSGVMCTLRWRKYAILILASGIVIVTMIPGITERITQGFSEGEAQTDLYEVTSGRNIAWPYEIEKIEEAPLFGYGRMSMQRTGLSEYLWVEYGESFPHPHNAYLEWILDNGIVGFIPVIIFYIIILKCSLSLLLDKRSSEFMAIGGMTFALVFSLLVAAIGSQTLYPREGSVGMWCSIGLMLRIYVERAKASSIADNGMDIGSLLWKK